jgi:TonB family protein
MPAPKVTSKSNSFSLPLDSGESHSRLLCRLFLDPNPRRLLPRERSLELSRQQSNRPSFSRRLHLSSPLPLLMFRLLLWFQNRVQNQRPYLQRPYQRRPSHRSLRSSPYESPKSVKKVEPVQESKPASSPSISDSFPLAGSKSLNPSKPKSVPVTASPEVVSSLEPLATADSIGYPAPQVPTDAPALSSVKVNRKSASSSSIETRRIELTSSQIASEAVVGKPMFASGEDASAKQELGSNRTWMIAVAAVLVLGAGAGTYWWTAIHKSAAKSGSVAAAAPADTSSGAPAGAAQPGILPTGANSQPLANPKSAQNSAAAQKPGAVLGNDAPSALAAKSDKNPAIVTSHRPAVLPTARIAAPVTHNTSASIAATPAPDVTSKAASVPAGSLSAILPGMGQPSSVPAPPPPSKPSGPAPSASVLQQPKLLQSSAPIYPRIAATRGDWGDVVIDALVSESGKVTDAKVISGADTLRQSALQVVRTQTYQPAKLNGKPVSMHVTVKVPFPKPR